MSAPRLLALPALLCALGACVHNAPNKQTLAPKAGPKASIYAMYTGGLLNRQADATFKVDQAAYTLVAHLGGDGMIEVLHPTDARETGRVPGGKWFRTQSFTAYYDAVPELYSFAMTKYRALGAQMDSYDGRGHGYIFLIASRHPLRFDRISDFGLWNDYEVPNYRTSMDPREAIKTFADMVAGGREYTLQFARSNSTTAMTSYADQMFDCTYLSAVGLAMTGSYWGYGYSPFYSSFGSLNSLRGNGCGNSYALGYYADRGFFFPRPTTPINPQSPEGGGTLSFTRPGVRRLGGTGPALGLNRPARGGAPTGTATAPVYAPPSTRGRSLGPRSTDFGASAPRPTRTYDPARETPVREAPRSFSPRESPVERAQPVREAPRVTAPREAPPVRETPPPAPREVARPNSEARKPPEDRKP